MPHGTSERAGFPSRLLDSFLYEHKTEPSSKIPARRAAPSAQRVLGLSTNSGPDLGWNWDYNFGFFFLNTEK